MISLHTDPPTASQNAGQLFAQKIMLTDGDRVLGRAVWSATADSQGVVQLLEVWIDPAVRRAGYGRKLLRGLVDQARDFHKLRQQSLRRLWIGVGHKSQVVGRSFLTSEGFHHVGTTGGLLDGEDMLIYVKSLD